VVSGATPVLRESEHYFFDLSEVRRPAARLVQGRRGACPVKAKLASGWMPGLRAWDISRDAPYFGFEIPGAPGKFFYVWLDAPIGYLASFKAFAMPKHRGLKPDYDASCVLETAQPSCTTSSARTSSTSTACSGRRCCTVPATACRPRLHVNGYLTVNGAKMSKSRGTFIQARTYLDHPQSGMPALLLRGQDLRAASTTSTSTSRISRHA
jgi:methionyl-tRNA synthetase